jgi:1-phosphofructokinase family hexose kinase
VILVAGLSPAYQRILTFDTLRTGEVNRAQSVAECPSGKSINVAVALKSLNVPSQLFTALGGARGERLLQQLQADLDISVEAVETIGETRFCQTLLSQDGSRTTELVEESPPLTTDELEDFERRFKRYAALAQFVVLTGSVPAGVPRTLYRDLLNACGKPALVDAQGELLRESLAARPLVIKPNRQELAATVQRDLHSDEDVVAAARELQQAGAQWVIVTDGPHPLHAIGPDAAYRVFPPQPHTVVNPIGSGDSLAAGLVAVLQGQESPDIPAAIRNGVACAVANLSAVRPALLDPALVEEYRSQVRVEQL